jgi:hypothetical protein
LRARRAQPPPGARAPGRGAQCGPPRLPRLARCARSRSPPARAPPPASLAEAAAALWSARRSRWCLIGEALERRLTQRRLSWPLPAPWRQWVPPQTSPSCSPPATTSGRWACRVRRALGVAAWQRLRAFAHFAPKPADRARPARRLTRPRAAGGAQGAAERFNATFDAVYSGDALQVRPSFATRAVYPRGRADSPGCDAPRRCDAAARAARATHTAPRWLRVWLQAQRHACSASPLAHAPRRRCLGMSRAATWTGWATRRLSG